MLRGLLKTYRSRTILRSKGETREAEKESKDQQVVKEWRGGGLIWSYLMPREWRR
jgi:hypothetical protein